MKKSKRMKQVYEGVERSTPLSLEEAVEKLQSAPKVKFDQTVDFAMKLGIDPKKSDQQVRGSVFLPHGTGKKSTIVVFAKGEKAEEAKAAGADFVGHEDLFEKIKGGWTDFTAAIATPDMMRDLGKLAKVLGPRGLMPSPKSGTVTLDVKKAIEELKAGKVEFKANKTGVIDTAVGKLSFSKEHLVENIKTLIGAIAKAKPASAKQYILSLALSSTMGPGIKIQTSQIQG